MSHGIKTQQKNVRRIDVKMGIVFVEKDVCMKRKIYGVLCKEAISIGDHSRLQSLLEVDNNGNLGFANY